MTRRAILFLLCAAFWLPSVALAQVPPAQSAEEAAAELRAAIAKMNDAESGKDRVTELTNTIEAYETGLALLRGALRQVKAQEEEIEARLSDEQRRIARLLGAMVTLERGSGPLLLLHPGGALDTARSGMLLSVVSPAIQAQATALRQQLDELGRLRTVRQNAAATLQKGMDAAQRARTELSRAMQDRTGLPERFLEDPEELSALLASADTLDDFANGIAEIESDIGAPANDFLSAKGALRLPVRGTLLRQAGEQDAAGIRRPGVLIATEPNALVTAPSSATIRYRGPLLDYGNVIILEPETGYLLVIAGMNVVYGETGDILAKGAPIGLMGSATPPSQQFSAKMQEGSGALTAETLYMELRQGKTPVNPAEWFILAGEN